MSQELEEPNFIQPGMLKDENDQSGTTGWNFADQRFGAFIFVVSGTIALVLLLIIFLREFYWRKYRVDLCPNFRRGRRRQHQNDQMDADREMAEELQQRLNEELREAERLAKRKERQAWYEIFIKDYTMTAKSEDLFFAHEIDNASVPLADLPTAATTEEATAQALKNLSSTSISDEEEIDDIEGGAATKKAVEPVVCDASEDDAHLYLRLPVKDSCGNYRTVDGHCAICVSEYEADDHVVWSGLECKHAFHDECILPWLSKGKKRCPICRHWFVPGTRIEDQKKEMEERLRLEAEAEAAGDSETSDETEPSESPADAEQSGAEIESGDCESLSPSQDLESEASQCLDVEAAFSKEENAALCVENGKGEFVAHDKQITSSQEFGAESEELKSESQDLGGLETV